MVPTVNFIFVKSSLNNKILIDIARPKEGILINGKEWLLEENGETMKFENKEKALKFLKLNVFDQLIFCEEFYLLRQLIDDSN